MDKDKYGSCKLCGNTTALTYEHVPPKNAHNKNRFYIFPSDSSINDPFLEKPKGKPEQGGIGYYSLCESCNTKTGAWYGKSYIDFVNQPQAGASMQRKLKARRTCALPICK